MTDFLVYGSVAWDAPWLTEHNLAHALAGRGNRVLFVEPPVSLAAPIRAPRGGTVRLLRRRVRPATEVFVAQFVTLPPVSSRRVQRFGAPLRRLQIERALKRLEMRSPVTIATRDVATIHSFDDTLRIYLAKDWIQAGDALLGRDRETLAAEVAEMAGWADVVCAISPQLQRGLAAEGIESALLRHGFHADLRHVYERSGPPPPDLARLPRPWLGYAGRIDGRLDVDTLTRLADRFREGTVVMVGPVSPRFPPAELDRLREKPNIALVGARPREGLPSYLAAFDCALMPYSRSEWARYGSPLKLWDLLFAGPPIVGSGYLALRDYAPRHLAFAEHGEDFLAAVERALLTGSHGADARRRFALANSWAARAEELEGLVATAAAGEPLLSTS